MLVTLYPPSVDGIVIWPVVVLRIAEVQSEPELTDAVPSTTEYVHVMPLTVSVNAHARPTAQNATISARSRTIKAILSLIAALLILPCCAEEAKHDLRILQTSRHVSQEVVGITQSETQREVKRLRVSSA